jgi:hypothetical protein
MTSTSIRFLSLAIGSFLCIGVVSACASEEVPKGIPDAAIEKPMEPVKQCNPQYCPEVATGKGCCLPSDHCGADFGLGCVSVAKKDGG